MSYLQPLFPAFLLLTLLGLFRVWFRPHDRPWLLTAGLACIVLLSLNPVAWLASRPLEIWYDQNPAPDAPADAIVILAGSVGAPLPNRPYAVLGWDTYLRLQRGVWLFKHWAARPILTTGRGEDSESYSQAVRQFLDAEGIPTDKIWLESSSRSTYENAMYSAKILRKHHVSRIALVTDARSMARAEACFRKQGIAVVPAPFRFYNLHSLEDVIPNWRAIEANGDTAHELIGLLWYRLNGWI